MPISSSRRSTEFNPWITIFDLDFRNLPTQDLLPGGAGYKTVSGRKLYVGGTADCSAFGIVNGVGLRRVISTTLSSREIPVSYSPAPDADNSPYNNFNGDEMEASFWLGHPGTTLLSGELFYGFFGEQTVGRRFGVGYSGSGTGNQPISYTQYCDPSGFPQNGPTSSLDQNHDAFAVRMRNARYAESYSSLYTTDFPTRPVRMRFSRDHGVVGAAWATPPNGWYASSTYITNGNCAGRTLILKRMRVRVRV